MYGGQHDALTNAFSEIESAIVRATNALESAFDTAVTLPEVTRKQLDSLALLADSLQNAEDDLRQATKKIRVTKVSIPARQIKTNKDPNVDCASIGRDRKRCEEYARCTWTGSYKGCAIDPRKRWTPP